jgi:hypothetical protein
MEGRTSSLTEAYKHGIAAYISATSDKTAYTRNIVELHKYYKTTTRFSNISFTECVNEMVKHFMPDEYFKSCSNAQRDAVLHDVISKSVRAFSADIMKMNILNALVENDRDPTLMRRMQDIMVEKLMYEQERLAAALYNTANKISPNDAMVQKMKLEIIKLVKINSKLSLENKRLVTKFAKIRKETAEVIAKQKQLESRKVSPPKQPIQQSSMVESADVDSDDSNDTEFSSTAQDDKRRQEQDDKRRQEQDDKRRQEQDDKRRQEQDDKRRQEQDDDRRQEQQLEEYRRNAEEQRRREQQAEERQMREQAEARRRTEQAEQRRIERQRVEQERAELLAEQERAKPKMAQVDDGNFLFRNNETISDDAGFFNID